MEAVQLIRAFIFSVLLTTSPALGDVPARLETAFRGWVAENGVSEAVMVVSQRGQQVAQVALNRQVDAPIEHRRAHNPDCTQSARAKRTVGEIPL